MAYRNKVFVSFDGDSDIHYYRLMKAWSQNDNTPFDLLDAHDINAARDSSTEETIKRRLSERMASAKVVVSLIGNQTRYLYRFVRWELEQAIARGLPIVGVNLNKRRALDTTLCPPVIREELAVYVSFNTAILQHALENWPTEHYKLKGERAKGPRYYPESVYKRLGL